ncbi:MAG: hypothetical protein A3C46_06065 [Deltaproteobacteria bacterium RIFCSPHIGHO2_02_FULL_44_16]|nr:MAG: hypothetical protein A3C46_06065 [Deltaproteobacteria bacterium RIFCSPHIGHO2_02_FULL_44_16]
MSLARSFRYLFFIVGVGLLFLLIQKIGLKTIVFDIRMIGWRFFPLFCISFLWYLFYTYGWNQFLKRTTGKIRFAELFRIKIAGEAVNVLTPVNFVGGDPMRIYMLKRNIPVTEAAASVVVDRTLHSMATLLVVVIGIIISFLTLDHLPENIQYGVPIVLCIALLFIGFIFVHQRRGIFSFFLSFCQKIGIERKFSEKTIQRFEELDSHIIDFYQSHHRDFLIALGAHTLGRFLGVVEIYVVGRIVSDDFTLFAALVLCALAPMINLLFTFVPGALGILEGAYSGVLYLLGFDPSLGITIQVAKRLRAGCWVALGLLFLGAETRKKAYEEKFEEA